MRPLPGSEDPSNEPSQIFWSPDSRFVVFHSLSGGKIRKLDISGGSPQTLCDARVAVGFAWNTDGLILFGSSFDALKRVSAAGGVATPMTVLDASRKETGHRWPQFLPDGHHFLYHRASANPQYTGIYVGSIDAKPEEQSLKPLLISDREGLYAAPQNGGMGQLLFLRESTLFAQPFDAGRMELRGDAVRVADQVGSYPLRAYGMFSISQTGVLVYRVDTAAGAVQLTWVDRQGKAISTVGEPGTYTMARLSPDGTRVAVTKLGQLVGNRDIWVLDIRGNSTRLTFDPARNDFPVWSPDGKNIAFSSNREGHMDLYRKAADGSGEPTLLLTSDQDKNPYSWSPDGRYLIYGSAEPKNAGRAVNVLGQTYLDLWILPLGGDQKPIPFQRTGFNHFKGVFSPNGRWIAYGSNLSGAYEIYVSPFSPNAGASSATGSKAPISKGGGVYPVWRADGKELFYITLTNQQMAVSVSTGETFQYGGPRLLFRAPPAVLSIGTINDGDISPDGKRFLYTAPSALSAVGPFTVVLNWQAALKK